MTDEQRDYTEEQYNRDLMHDNDDTITMPAIGMDVAEACADALLAACAQALVLNSPTIDDPVSIGDTRSLAIQTIDHIIDRTYREGPKPR